MLAKRRIAQPGYSIIEITLVIGLVVFLMGGIWYGYSLVRETLRKNETRTTLAMLRTKIEEYYSDTGQYPQNIRDLVTKPQGEEAERWGGPYVQARSLKDGWGKAIRYELTPEGKHEFELYTKSPQGTKFSAWQD